MTFPKASPITGAGTTAASRRPHTDPRSDTTGAKGAREDRSALALSGCAYCGGPVPLDHRCKPPRPRTYCDDNCRRKTKYMHPCVRCGAQSFSYSDGATAVRLCRDCAQADWAALASEMEAVRIAEWQAMWAQGMTAREIGEATGWKRLSVHASIAKFRARGYDFPSRRPPHMVEVGRRMTQARQERAV